MWLQMINEIQGTYMEVIFIDDTIQLVGII